MLVKIENGVPVGHLVTDENFRMLFPEVSFPRVLTHDVVVDYGFDIADYAIEPTPALDEVVVQTGYVKGSDGVWRMTYETQYVPPSTQELNTRAKESRYEAFLREADPLFFAAQRGEATLQEWQLKVADIRARFPYQE